MESDMGKKEMQPLQDGRDTTVEGRAYGTKDVV